MAVTGHCRGSCRSFPGGFPYFTIAHTTTTREKSSPSPMAPTAAGERQYHTDGRTDSGLTCKAYL